MNEVKKRRPAEGKRKVDKEERKQSRKRRKNKRNKHNCS
jgi:hypothetical protein